MSENPHPKRRDFLKTAAAGAAGAMGLSALKFEKLFAQTTTGWVSGMQVNPAIDNKRVICCHDTNMLTSTPTNTSFTSQNAAVNATLVASNLDEMAKQLAQKATAADAWSTIFRSSKPWASTKVAIKTNAILGTNGNHPRVAVIKKICDVFVDQLGVPAANIILYDANSDASSCYSTYGSLTDATKIRATISKYAQSLGGMVPVTITASTKTMSGVGDLVNGVIDILVDIAIVKRHSGPGTSYLYGSCSLCMKNHLGTFINSGTDNAPSSTGLHSVDAICNINKHAAILGGNPVRQQLCIVDGPLANGNGAGGSFDTRVDRMIMGTFAPIVDYLTAMRIMKDVMGKPDANNNVPKFLTNFNYAETDALQWVEYVPGSQPPIGGAGGSTGSGGTGGSTGATGGTTGGSGGTTGSTGGTTGSTGGTTGARGGTTGSTGGTTGARGGSTGSTGGSTGSTGGTTGARGGTAGSTDGTTTGSTGGTVTTSGTGGTGTTATTSDTGGTSGAATSAVGGTSGAATSATSASGGSTATRASSGGGGTTASAAGGSPGTSGPPQATGTGITGGKSAGGCSVAGIDRKVTRWGAMAALGTVVAARLRRLVSGDDKSS
jgi:hypothetical protein